MTTVTAVVNDGKSLQRHPKWHLIKQDLILATLTFEEICHKYKLIKPNGAAPVLLLAHAIRRIRENNKELFDIMDQQEKQFLRHEYIAIVRDGVKMGRETRERALENNEYHYALEAEKQILNAASKLGEVVDVNQSRQPAIQPGFTQHNTYNLLTLPKAPGVPIRPPQLVEAQKEITA